MAPPPTPPPPMEDDFLTNGLLEGQSQNEGAVALPSFGSGDVNGAMDTTPPAPPVKEPQVWEKPLSIPDIRKSSNNWSLASDAGLLLYLQEFSQKMLTKTSDLEKKMDGLIHETKCTDSRVHNVFNDFLMLANTQFIENRVYDDSEETDQKPDAASSKKEDQTKTREQREAEVIPRVIKALNLGINVLDSAFEQLDANVGNSDSEDEDATYKAVVEPILEPKDLYAHRSLPYLIGSPAFMQDDNVGVADILEEDMNEDGSISDSEKTTSESESEYTDTESEIESESDIATKQKMDQQERSQSESENDLFDQNEKSSENEDEEKTKGGAFASELAARIGTGPARAEEEETERGRTVSEASGVSTSSKGKKRKKGTGKDKTGKRRSASKTSGDNLFDEPAPMAGAEEEESSPFGKRGGLFSSSGGGLFEDEKEEEGDLFDEAPKPRAVNRRDDHIYEDIGNAVSVEKSTTKSGKKIPAGAVPLFGDGTGEDDLFGSSPKSNEAGRKHKEAERKASMGGGGGGGGGGGLFDDENDNGLFAAAPKPAKKEVAKKTVELFDDDEDGDLFGGSSADKPVTVAAPAPAPAPERKASTKKKGLAGAVSMFGTVDPLAAKRASGDLEEHEEEPSGPPPVAKRAPKAAEKKTDMFDDDKGESDLFGDNAKSKPEPVKTPERNSLFADEDGEQDGLFADKESIHVPATVKPAAAKLDMNKKSSSGSLFDDIEGDGDDDLFGASSQPKETTKKKPAGGVALFAGADMFGTSPKKEEEEKPPVKRRNKTPKSRTTLSLFDDNDEKDQLSAGKDDPVARRRTKSKSVFDDEDVLFKIHEEAPPVDLFGSVSPVSATKPDSNLTKPRSASSTSKSLFSDEEEDDLFSSASKATPKPASKPQPAKKAPAGKPKADLFSRRGDEDDLFGGVKPSLPEVKDRSDSKPSAPEVKAKPVAKKEEIEASDGGPAQGDPLFGEQSSAPATATKPKKPAGAVSMFAGLDPSAISRQISSGSTNDDEEDKRNRLPSTENISPQPFVASSSNKPVSVIRSVKAPMAKKSPGAGNRVSMLQSNLVIDPTAMRPGAAPPSKDFEPEGVTFENPPKLNTLSSLNKGRARISAKRRAPSRRHRTEGVMATSSSPMYDGATGPLMSTSPDPLFEDRSPLSGLRNISSRPRGTSDESPPSSSSASVSKPKEKVIPAARPIDFNSPLDFISDITTTPSSVSKPATKSSDMFGNDDLKTTVSAPLTTKDDGKDLFATTLPTVKAKPPLNVDEDLFSSSPSKKQETSKKTVPADPFDEDLFREVPKSKKPGKKSGKTKPLVEDDDLFATDTTKKDAKSSAPLPEDDGDLFASVPAVKTKKKKEAKKVQLDDEDDPVFATKKPSEKKTPSKKMDSDLFGDSSSSIFDDIPSSKPKEKKKKKESSLFTDQGEDDIFASPTSSKSKKTKTKKKTTDKQPAAGGSIIDESAPSIFDDPLNALGN